MFYEEFLTLTLWFGLVYFIYISMFICKDFFCVMEEFPFYITFYQSKIDLFISYVINKHTMLLLKIFVDKIYHHPLQNMSLMSQYFLK